MISLSTPILPNTTVQDLHGLYGILALLKDPEAFQKRLDQITELTQKHEETRTKAVTEKAEAALKRSEVEALQREIEVKAQKTLEEVSQVQKVHESRTLELNQRQESIVSRETALSKAENALAEDRKKHEAEYNQKMAEVGRLAQSSKAEMDQRLAALEAKEALIDTTLSNTQKDAAEAKALRAALDQKHEALRKVIGE